MARVQTDLTGLVRGGGLSNLYFEVDLVAGDASALTLAVREFWAAALQPASSQVTANVRGVVQVIDPATGQIINETGGDIPPAAQGTDNGTPLPPATQALLRMRTAGIQNGRKVLGKVNVPGANAGWMGPGGTVAPFIRGVLIAAAGDLNEDPAHNGQVVWSRAAGASFAVTSYDVWGEFSVLRSRRD